MHRQNIQHSPSMSLPFGWHQSNQGNAGSAYLETWWRVRVEKKKRCEKEIDNLTQLVSTYESFKVLHVFSCSFRMFHAGSTSFPGHSLGEICELCSSTTQHSAPHETTCRAVGGNRNKTYYEMPKHDPCQRHNSSWWYMLILYRWIKIACDPVYNGWAQCSWHLELEHSPKKISLTLIYTMMMFQMFQWSVLIRKWGENARGFAKQRRFLGWACGVFS